jgi:hypothetical protein
MPINNNFLIFTIIIIVMIFFIIYIISIFSDNKKQFNLTNDALKDVFIQKDDSDEKIKIKYIKIAYKKLYNKDMNIDKYLKKCLEKEKKTKSFCLNLIFEKYMTSSKIKECEKKDLFSAYYISLLKNRLNNGILSEKDFYDENKQILYIQNHNIPRKINDTTFFFFKDVFIFRNETKLDDLTNDLYRIYKEIQLH